MIAPEFVLSIVNCLGIFALLAMGYGFVLRRVRGRLQKGIVIGVMFGTGASLAIANTTQLEPGLFIDPRAAMLVLAAPFGGPAAAIVSALIASAARLYGGGVGATAGVANIFAIALIGVLFNLVAYKKNRPKSFRDLIVLGVTGNIPLLLIFTVPLTNPTAAFLQAIGPLTIANTLGVLLLGWILNNERTMLVKRRVLEREATTDSLTGLLNRRQFLRIVDDIVEVSQGTGKPLSILAIDLDLFKQVNDRFGHDVGDIILVKVCNTIRLHTRSNDAVARFGGEEIVVAMPNTDTGEALAIAKRIRTAVDQQVFHGSHESGNVTVSIGVATQRGKALSFRSLFRAADDALYLAKDRGRNRVENAAQLAA